MAELDIAVLYADQPERGLAIEPLLLEELFYVTAEPHRSPIRIADAAQRPLLLPVLKVSVDKLPRKRSRNTG